MKRLFLFLFAAILGITQVNAISYTIGSSSYTINTVDMGTGDNIVWGDRALGASSTTVNGCYWQYGSVEVSTSASCKDTYKYDGLFTTTDALPADKDIATIILGAGWRIPTKTEFETLKSKATFARKSTSKRDFTVTYSTNTIGLNFGGYKKSYSVNDASGSGYGRFWTSNIETKSGSQEAYWFQGKHTTSSPYVTTSTGNSYTYYGLQILPVYDSQKYTLTIQANGSKEKQYTDVWGKETESYTVPNIPGKEFVKWNDGNTNKTRTFKICNITYNAIYEDAAITYQLSWDAQGGSIPSGYSIAGQYEKDATITLKNPTKTGYTFAGWYRSDTKTTLATTTTSILMPATDLTLTAQWNQVSYVTATFYNYDGETELYQDTKVVSGTTPTYGGSTPEKPQDETYDYDFTGWSPALANITANQNYTAQFTPVYRNYSVTFRTSKSDKNPNTKSGYHYNDPIRKDNVPTDPMWIGEEAYLYGMSFVGWALLDNNDNQTETFYDENTKVTGNMIFEAAFEPDYYDTDTVTVVVTGGDGKITLNYNGETARTMDTKIDGNSKEFVFVNGAQNKRLTAVATPARGYHVEGAASKMLQPLKTTTISFTFAANTPLDLIENHDNTNYNDTLVENHKTQFLSVSVMTNQTTPRSIGQGYWATIYMPFDYTVTPEDDFYDQVYALVGGSVDANNIATLNFVKQTKLTAYVPYLITAKNTIEKLFFDGVKLTSFQGKSLFIEAGNVDFIGTLSTVKVKNEDANNKTNFYIANSAAGVSLKYASANGATLYGYRAYFSKNNNAGVAGAPARRAIVDLDGEEYEMVITEDGDIAPANVARKYIQNGQLIIERDGVKYNTLGAIAE